MQTTCFENCSQVLTLEKAFYKDGRYLKDNDWGLLENVSIIFNDEQILFIGSKENAPAHLTIHQTIDMKGKSITPEVIDSHTHAIFAGDRSFEYTMRLNGASYEDIFSSGGGILHTMKQTRETLREDLKSLLKNRILKIHSYGIGTIEVKSGYGLNYEKEKELTFIIHEIKNELAPKIQIINTFMCAHALPPEFKSTEEYMDKVVIPLLENLAPFKIIDFVDIFHEQNYFTDQDVLKLIHCAQKNQIALKMHADELNNNDGARMALDYDFTSCDHLLKIDSSTIADFVHHDTVATLLPGTALFLGKQFPPALSLLNAGAKVAIASDYNPGSCHCDNLLKITAMTAKSLQMNACQAWAAITLNAAHALNLRKQGALMVGMKPRFSIFQTDSIHKIFYEW